VFLGVKLRSKTHYNLSYIWDLKTCLTKLKKIAKPQTKQLWDGNNVEVQQIKKPKTI
jgi:hypothetical protein